MKRKAPCFIFIFKFPVWSSLSDRGGRDVFSSGYCFYKYIFNWVQRTSFRYNKKNERKMAITWFDICVDEPDLHYVLIPGERFNDSPVLLCLSVFFMKRCISIRRKCRFCSSLMRNSMSFGGWGPLDVPEAPWLDWVVSGSGCSVIGPELTSVWIPELCSSSSQYILL